MHGGREKVRTWKRERIRKAPNHKVRSLPERMTGVEPASTAWEAVVLPMNYIREVALLAHKWSV